MPIAKGATAAEIEAYADRIARRFRPEKIILFGSHTRGDSDEGSDVDLLVLMDFEGPPQEQAYRIRREIPRAFPLDLMVRRPADARRRVEQGDFFLREVFREGRVLYERSGA